MKLSTIINRLEKLHPDLQHVGWDGVSAFLVFYNADHSMETNEFKEGSETHILMVKFENKMFNLG